MAEFESILVSPRERKIIETLRELPDGELKRTAEAFLIELSGHLSNPRCAEVQADGIPCDSVEADCEQCLELLHLIEELRERLAQQVV